MDRREVIERLVTEVAPNATVARFEERDDRYVVTVAGTTSVLARCELSRQAVDAAEWSDADRARVAATLKRCADDVIAPLPDGRA
jgi:hypothetical protein